MKRLIIGAPFGNYFHFENTTRTLGTYTVNRRAGFWLRLWRVLRTVRYWRRTQSWVNKLGLPSPGVAALEGHRYPGCLLSVHGFDSGEWQTLAHAADRLGFEGVEFNLSCPNIEHRDTMLAEATPGLEFALGLGLKVIAKLPPIRWLDMGKRLFDLGVRHFHLCNTLPTPGGGLSGKPLMQYSLWAIDDFRRAFGDEVTLIGGGGVTCPDDVRSYRNAGADHVAIASMLFNPLNWRKVKHLVAAMA